MTNALGHLRDRSQILSATELGREPNKMLKIADKGREGVSKMLTIADQGQELTITDTVAGGCI